MLLTKCVKCSQKFYLFKTYCCNLHFESFWYDSAKTVMKNLKVAYNNSLRRLLRLPSHNIAQWYVCKFEYSFFWRIAQKICV